VRYQAFLNPAAVLQHGPRNVTGDTDNNREEAARRTDHAFRMEASRGRLVASRKLLVSTAVIIREARVTIYRTLEMLGIGLPPDASGDRHKRPVTRVYWK
jgi:hypothetical protein